jgi:hypothetical protein
VRGVELVKHQGVELVKHQGVALVKHQGGKHALQLQLLACELQAHATSSIAPLQSCRLRLVVVRVCVVSILVVGK